MVLRGLPPVGEALQRGGDPVAGSRRGPLHGVDEVHRVSGLGGDLGDARAHRTGPDDGDGSMRDGGLAGRRRHVTHICRFVVVV